jgi:hypothetical protein
MSYANGFVPLCYASGAPYNGAYNVYYHGSGDGLIGCGDPVVRKTASADPLGGKEAVFATTGGAISGVCVGVEASPLRIYQANYLASTDVGYLCVADDPTLIFEVVEGGSGTALTVATAVGLNINSITAVSPSTLTGYSTMAIDNGALSAGNTWAIVGLSQTVGNVVGTIGTTKWLVKASLHTEATAGAQTIKNI